MKRAAAFGLRIGRLLAGLVGLAGGAGCAVLAGPAVPVPRFSALLIGGLVLALLVHELGHFLAARLLGIRVTAVHLGSPRTLVTIKLGTVALCLGLMPRGKVALGGRIPAARRALVTAAGPAANLVAALIVLLVLPIPRWSGEVLAVLFATTAATNLLPFRTRSGSVSDGLNLLRAPGRIRAEASVRRLVQTPDWGTRSDAADRLLHGCRHHVPEALGRFYVLARLLSAAGRTDDLLEVHNIQWSLPDEPSQLYVAGMHSMEWIVLTLPQEPDKAAADLAARRVSWVLQHVADAHRAAGRHTMAVARLRQGRFADVEPLCADALAATLPADQRATVLATVAMARHALGLPGRPALTEAVELDPDAAMVAEAASMLGRDAGMARPV
jgi:Peptidase family M50